MEPLQRVATRRVAKTMTETQRIDQWLSHARFFKTRGLATKQVQSGHVRVDGERVQKASFALRPGVTLTFKQSRRIRIVRVQALAARRGPASEAQTLYVDLSPPEEQTPPNPRFDGKGRPTGKDRRNARLYRTPPLD